MELEKEEIKNKVTEFAYLFLANTAFSNVIHAINFIPLFIKNILKTGHKDLR